MFKYLSLSLRFSFSLLSPGMASRFGMEDAPCIQQKRANIFKEKNSDLALIAKTWPDLLPGVSNDQECKEVQA